MFLRDIYHGRDILRANIIPDDLIFQNPVFRPEMNGQDVPHDVYVHIAGINIVRVDAEKFLRAGGQCAHPFRRVLHAGKPRGDVRLFPDLFARHRVSPVEKYPDELLSALRSVAPFSASGEPTVELVTPVVFRSAWYKHPFLADKLGIELVEGRDLIVKNDEVFMRTTEGLKRIDVSTAGSTTTSSIPSPSARIGARVPGLCRPMRRAMSRWPMRSAPDPRRQGGLLLHARHRELPRRRTDPEECADLALPRAEDLPTCSTTSATSWSRKCTAPAATAC